jgi:hypothetical protein
MQLKIYRPEEDVDVQVGDAIEWLTIEKFLPTIDGHVMLLCRCVCGAERRVRKSDLLRRRTRSCGVCCRYPHTKPSQGVLQCQSPTIRSI